MIALILLACIAAALGLYFGLIRPFVIPLQKRIPTDPRYLPTQASRMRLGLGVRR